MAKTNKYKRIMQFSSRSVTNLSIQLMTVG